MALLERRLIRHVNWTPVICGAILNIVGLLSIYSATANSVPGSPFYYLKRQLIAVITGAVIAFVLFRMDYTILRQRRREIYAATLVLLVAVLIFGQRVNGAKSWIPLGAFTFQPAEFAKLAVIIMLAHLLEGIDEYATWRDMLPAFVAVGVPMALVLVQPDLGTTLVFGAILLGMMFMAGVPRRVQQTVIGAGLAAMPIAYLFVLKEYQRKRLLVFLNPYQDSLNYGYNVIQSMIAVGSGRFFGRGYLNGTQGHLNFLPEHHTDFIFAVFAEEWGFLGCIALLGVFGWLLWNAARSLMYMRDRFAMLMATGIISMWLFHILENVGMATGIMPITGIPLPFLSYGGTAEWVNMAALGILVNVQTRKTRPLF